MRYSAAKRCSLQREKRGTSSTLLWRRQLMVSLLPRGQILTVVAPLEKGLEVVCERFRQDFPQTYFAPNLGSSATTTSRPALGGGGPIDLRPATRCEARRAWGLPAGVPRSAGRRRGGGGAHPHRHRRPRAPPWRAVSTVTGEWACRRRRSRRPRGGPPLPGGSRRRAPGSPVETAPPTPPCPYGQRVATRPADGLQTPRAGGLAGSVTPWFTVQRGDTGTCMYCTRSRDPSATHLSPAGCRPVRCLAPRRDELVAQRGHGGGRVIPPPA